jgi:hypothetical protein
MWLPPAQDGRSVGQDANADKLLKNKGGQDGQDGTVTKTAIGENTGAHITDVSPRKEHRQKPVPAHGSHIRPVHPVHPVQASNGAGFGRTGHGDTEPSILSELRPWTDDRAWISEAMRAAPGDERMSVLFWWVVAAGGWIEGTTARLPALQAGIARNELHRMLRQNRLAVHERDGS